MRLNQALRWAKPVDWMVRCAAAGEAWWFDVSRGVRTAGSASLTDLTLAGRSQDGRDYLATRARNVKRVLRQLPPHDRTRFTFIDLGSGKGRVLFLAAEYPYRQIRGVEFARELHLQAEQNIRTFRSRKTPHETTIQSLYMDAGEFEFPEDPLVIYLFNPFPPSTLRRVLDNLRRSLDRTPREIFLLSVYPADLAAVFESATWLQTVQRTPQHHLYVPSGI